MQKQENFLSEAHRSEKDVLFWVQNIKVPFGVGHPSTCTSNLVYMCAGRFRGHKSSNRIELSRFVQESCNSSDSGFLGSGGWGRWVGGIWGHGGCPHTHAHARTCTHAHLYMYRNCKWPPTWRHPCLACLTCMCVHACVHVRACMGHPYTHPCPPPPPSVHLPPPHGGGPPESLKIR